ncbi:MAG: NAD(P)-binding protein [Promethearchaeota archaeon]
MNDRTGLRSNENDGNDKENCDIIIIGGSIAGNLIAALLGKTRLSVHVVEKHTHVGLPLECAGIVSGKLENVISFPRSLVLNKVSHAKIFAPGSGRITIKNSDEPLVLDRIGLDKYFHELAIKRGVVYHLGETVKDIVHENDIIFVKTNKKIYETKFIIGCDGVGSIVGKKNGIKYDFASGKQVIVRLLKEGHSELDLEERACELHFNPSWKDLFGWIIPEGNALFRVGIAAKKHVNIKFKKFIMYKFKKHLEELVNERILKIINITGGTFPIGLMNHICFDKTILIGDAAKQVKASTGGGIVMLSIAAKLAAKAINQAFNHGNFSRKFLKKHYEKPCKKRILLNLKIHYIVHLALTRMDEKDYSFLFQLSTKPLIRKLLVSSADMDFPLIFLLKILLYPDFFKWLIKYLVKNPKLIFSILKILIFNHES